jgi:hypothetical protein
LNRFLPLLWLAACATEDSASEPQLLIPSNIQVDWDESFNETADGLVAVVPVDVMVYDPVTGDPVADERITVTGAAPGVWIAPADAVFPADPDDEAALWDAWRDRYVEVDAPRSRRSDPLRAATDSTGLVRVYVVVDRFPTSRGAVGGLATVAVTVATDDTEEPFLLTPR